MWIQARPRWGGRTLAAVSLAVLALGPAAAQDKEPRLAFYPSLQLRFVDGQAKNYFISHATVVNVSGTPMADLTFRQTFPGGFSARLIKPEAQAAFKRPDGFSESLESGVYMVRLPELRIAEATSLVVELTYQGRPASATFPGIEVEYTQAGEKRTEKGPDLTWDLAKYTRYSGTLREFIKRYAGLDMPIPGTGDDWGFSSLAARAAGKFPLGVVEIDAEPSGRLRFSLQAGVPGSQRNLLLMRRHFDPARQLKASDEVRRFVLDLVQATADFTLDGDNITIQKKRIGRYEGWFAETRWRDRVKDRLGEGPSYWYIFTDEKNRQQYIINTSAQGRGAGAGKADAPNPGREQELINQLEGIVTSLRVL